MPDEVPRFRTFAWRVVSLHTLTYFVLGLAALFLLDYHKAYETTELRHLMRPTTSPWVAVGPALQPVRGFLFALVLYPLAPAFMRGRKGALLLWALFVGLAILGTAGPSPGSLEGVLYTTLPLRLHLFGLPEVLLQTLLFSFALVSWCRRPARWKNIASAVSLGLVMLLSLAGLAAALSGPHH